MEIWVEVAEFPKYEASSEGRVRNKQRGNILGGTVTPEGYVRIGLYDTGCKQHHRMRSNIIAAAFWVKPDEKHITVDHINKQRDDDRAINLRWATKSIQSLNQDYTIPKNNYRPINQYDMNGIYLKTWRGVMDISNELGISPAGISKACKELGFYKCFIWRYHFEPIPGEKWRLAPYPEYEPLYASTHGRIMRMNGKVTLGSNNCGYLRISVGNKGSNKRSKVRTHIIICATFRGRNDDLTVNHEDKNITNNHWENLTYMTIADNIRHSFANGDNINRVRRVNKLSLEGELLAEYPSLSEAGCQNNLLVTSICNACSGRSLTSGGFKWQYVV